MPITDGPWFASAPHPQTHACVITNPRGRVIAAMVPNQADAEFICRAWGQLVNLWNKPAVLALLSDVVHLRDGRCFDFTTAAQVADHLFVLANFDLKMHRVYKAGRRWPLPKGDWLMSIAELARALEAF